MCEDCEQNYVEIMEEVTLLLAGEGEHYEALRRAAEMSFDNNAEREQALRSVVCEAAASRLATAASFVTDGAYHQLSPPMVMGIWAGNFLHALREDRAEELMKLFQGRGLN